MVENNFRRIVGLEFKTSLVGHEIPCASGTGRWGAPQKIYGDSSLWSLPQRVLAFNIKVK
jgi:hypothetical protein